MPAKRTALLPAMLAGWIALGTDSAQAESSFSAESARPMVDFPDEQGLPGILGTHSASPMRTGTIALGAADGLFMGGSLAKTASGSGPSGSSPTKDLDDALVSSFRGFIAAGLGLGVDASLVLPWYYESLPGTGAKPEAWSIGDLSGALKVRLPFDIPYIALCLFAQGTASTSTADGSVLPKELAFHPADGRYPDPLAHASGLARPSAGVGAGISLDLSQTLEGPQVALHVNVSGDRVLADGELDPLGTLTASAAMEAFVSGRVRLEAELRHQRLAIDWDALGEPVGRSTTLGAGIGWMTPLGFSLRAGGLLAPLAWNPYRNIAYAPGDGSTRVLRYRTRPEASGFLQLAWQGFPLNRDRDHDGVPDGRDQCPLAAEDRDGFQDEDGCPEPDNDGDGLPDASDACPYAPEDHDGFEDGDGCPEMDNDHDGLLDSLDRCPNDAEDRDGYQDEDGCPDLDDDKDGIPDAVDKCPREPENRNGIEDNDGCPEKDTDGDGIPDSRDKCPDEDEIINFYQDDDGCPDEKPEPIEDGVLGGIEFDAGGSELQPSSFKALDSLAAKLAAYPGTEIEIQGHLDDRLGANAKAISLARAEAVSEYLQGKGVEGRRLKPAGYGSSKPVGPNRTANGRAANRRIQIHRLN
jgi:outer membrane protein OmpA-like peptidoglycan-associated protein